MDAGHNHLKTPHFVTDCPLCEAEKAVRNRAIEHLSEALRLLDSTRQPGEQPTIRLNLAPIGVTGDDVERCHSIDLTAKQAEHLTDAIDTVSGITLEDAAVRDALAKGKARLESWMALNQDESIESGEWTAAAVVDRNTELYADVEDHFAALDLVEITRDILNEPQVNKLAVTQALDCWFGEIADPYADEDDD